jgi:hypothetical protein
MSINKPQRDFAKDRAICEAATPGPWNNEPKSDIGLLTDYVGRVIGFMETSEDREFSVAAREGWPAALDEIERLRAVLERIKKWAEDPEPGTMYKIWNLANETLKGDGNDCPGGWLGSIFLTR